MMKCTKKHYPSKSNKFGIVIPARGGSKRVPNKNIIDLNGSPLISYAIRECLDLTDEVYVSTNCSQIEEVARHHGAKIIHRPDELCQDTSKTEEAVDHFLSITGFSTFGIVQATTPMMKSCYLKEGLIKLSEFDSVFSVTERTEYYWDEEGNPVNFEIGKRKRTQDTKKWFCENGAFYLTHNETFQKRKCLYDGEVGFVIMPKTLSHEIDTIDDLEYVKTAMEMTNETTRNCQSFPFHPDYMEYHFRFSYGI